MPCAHPECMQMMIYNHWLKNVSRTKIYFVQNHYNIDEDEKAIIYQEKSNEKKNDSVN